MALSLQDGQKVWAKVAQALGNQVVGTAGTGSNPAAVAAFKGLKQWFVEQGGNPQLQFVPFTEAQADDDDGTGIVDAACKVYAVYIKKNTSGTDAYMKLYDSATVDTTAAQQIFALPLFDANKDAFQIHPTGIAMANGVTVTQHTTSIGVTDASEGANGFVIIGAP